MKKIVLLVLSFVCSFVFNVEASETVILDNVPFRQQSPPGDWNHNMNCGPASALMLAGYYQDFTPAETNLQAILDWLYENGYIAEQTVVGAEHYDGNATSASDIVSILGKFYNLAGFVKKAQANQELLIEQLEKGNPVVVGVNIRLDPAAGGHFMVLVGLDGTEVVVHDPGRTNGEFNRYPWDQFVESWQTSNRVVVYRETEVVTWHPDGAIIQPNNSNKIYVLINGATSWITDEAVFNAHNFDWNKIIRVLPIEFDCYPEGIAVDWQPYREVFQVGSSIYLMEKNSASAPTCAWYEFVSLSSFASWNIPGSLRIISGSEAEQRYFSKCDQGPKLYLRAGTIVKPDFVVPGYGAGVTFVALQNGVLRGFETYQVFQDMGYDLLPIMHLNEAEFNNSYQEFGSLITRDNSRECINGSYQNSGAAGDDFDLDEDGFSTWEGDCADNDPTINPDAPEICDGIDNNCNEQTDESAICPSNQSCQSGQCQEIIEVAEQESGDGDFEVEIEVESEELDQETSGQCVSDTDCTDSDQCTLDFCHAGQCYNVYRAELCSASDGDEDQVETEIEIIETNNDEAVHCTITCPREMRAYAWFGIDEMVSGQTAIVDSTKAEICLRGAPWIDFNCACLFPTEWACNYWSAAEVECNHDFRTTSGVVDYRGEGEIWFRDFSCY